MASRSASRIILDEETHLYRQDGVIVPSVTQIIEFVLKRRLPGEQARERVPGYFLRGRHIHHGIFLDTEDDLDRDSIAAEWDGYFRAYEKFKDELHFKAVKGECILVSPYGFCGRADAVGYFLVKRSKRWAAPDYKTGSAPWTTNFQTAAYLHMLEAEGYIRPGQCDRCSLTLHENGNYRLRDYPAKEYSRDLRILLAALNVLRVWIDHKIISLVPKPPKEDHDQ